MPRVLLIERSPTSFSWRYERARCGQLWPGGQAAGSFKVAELVGCACLSEHSPLMVSARNAIRGYGRAGFCGLSAMSALLAGVRLLVTDPLSSRA